jgi:integrase
VLFSQAAQGYLDFRAKRLSRRTLQIDRERLVPLLRAFAELPLESISAERVAAYQRQRLVAGVSPRTINMELGVLRRLLGRFGLWAPLASHLEMLPENPRAIRVLTADEKQRLFATARSSGRWMHACCAAIIASNTTCRKVELRHVRRGDVDLAGRLLSIRVSKGRTAGIRRLPLNDAAADAFAELLAWGERHGFAAAEDWVFPGRDAATHQRIRSRPVESWRSAWRSLTRSAGLEGLRFHDLRHQAVTELREHGVPDAVVMALSGHKSTAMLDHYTHARLNAMRQAVEQLTPQRPPVAAAPPSPGSLAEVLEALARMLRQSDAGNVPAIPKTSEVK